jgi:uncharacterized membrane protein YfcA
VNYVKKIVRAGSVEVGINRLRQDNNFFYTSGDSGSDLNELIWYLLVFLGVGGLTGIVAGLFGVGGGTVIVPALVLVFTAMNFDPAVIAHLAIGTSLSIIVFTAISSTLAHQSHGVVDWGLFRMLLFGVCIGVFAGAEVASVIEGAWLLRAFAGFLLLVALEMWFDWKSRVPIRKDIEAGWFHHGPAGIVIGLVSALFGIGGGSLTVPWLVFRGEVMQRAVGTAAAVGLPIAVSGALAYAWQGMDVAGLPEATIGYIYLPALAGVAVAGVPAARLGARWAHNLTARSLAKIFAVFLVMVAASLAWKTL